jgi:hypothetical protein
MSTNNIFLGIVSSWLLGNALAEGIGVLHLAFVPLPLCPLTQLGG